ncbi:MAG: diacylglycerol kinase family protein [Patescibacteria group bacterium]
MPEVGWEKSPTFAKSFHHALSGVTVVLKQHRNTRIIVLAAVLATLAALLLQLPPLHFAFIVFTSAVVLAAEMGNSALEELCDIVWPEYRGAVKVAKDLAGGAVLVLSVAAAAVGALLFIPPLLRVVLG